MNLFTRLVFVMATITLSCNSFAGTGAVTPHTTTASRFNSQIVAIDSLIRTAYATRNVNPFFDVREAAPASPSGWFAKGTHFCSCQIMHLSSSNYDHQAMAVFAEKTNRGEGTEFAEAKSRIEKEKKKLKKQFYDKVTVVAEMTAPVSCEVLYKQLKNNDQSLQVFDMLDADIK